MASEEAAAAGGRIEGVQFGAQYLVVSGWVARVDGSPVGTAATLVAGGREHPIAGYFTSEAAGPGSPAIAFCVDIAVDRDAVANGAIELRVDGSILERIAIGDLGFHSFRPQGRLETISAESVAGWVFDPGLWHGDEAVSAVELVVGDHWLPVTLDVTRKDLPFSAARAGRPIGFQLKLFETLARSLGRDVAAQLRQSGSVEIRLVSQGFLVASGKLVFATETRGPTAPPTSPAPPTPPPQVAAVAAGGAAAPAALAPRSAGGGDIDFVAYSEGLGGWLVCGWIDRVAIADLTQAEEVLIDGRVAGRGTLLTFARQDIGHVGVGLLGFVAAPHDATLRFETLRLGTARPHAIRRAKPLSLVGEQAAIEAMNDKLCAVRGGQATPLGRLLQTPAFRGGETLSKLGLPIRFEIENVVEAPGAGAMLGGWFADPKRLVRAIRLRSADRASQPLFKRWLWVDRPDVLAAVGKDLGLGHSRLGFRAFAEAPELALDQAYAEIRLHDGTIAFKPLPRAQGGPGVDLVGLLASIVITNANIEQAMPVLAPMAIAIKQAQLRAMADPVELTIGVPPAQPRVSIIVPLYDRVDFLRYQMALFSERRAEDVEYLYVLDDPAKIDRTIDLARAVDRSLGMAIRLLIMPENSGFAAASNAGLRAARGEYICFLNSDVMPRSPDWIETLASALASHPDIGMIGARLLFEDGTIQHIGMELRNQSAFGGLAFPIHVHKGRLPPPSDGIRTVSLVTGALMMMRRELALECGGFDTRYIVGDFEDADLCLRLRAKGYRCAVHDGATLYHLERQSQPASANNWARNRTLVNAWTFNQRWDTRQAPLDMLPGRLSSHDGA